MTTSELNVPAISCEHCARTITEALEPLPGVQSVSVDIPTHKVLVQFDPAQIGIDQISETLLQEEYPVTEVTGA